MREEHPLVFATGNQHKVREFREICAALPLELKALADYPRVDAPPETGDTFCQNAMQKAVHACEQLDLPCCADDSGLSVPSLGGAPGVHSARFAGPSATDDDRNRLLLQRLENSSERAAYFTCAVVLVIGDEHLQNYAVASSPNALDWDLWRGRLWIWRGEATVFGEIVQKPAGEEGFGYDPLFYHSTSGSTFAQINMKQKNKVSHRGHAFRMMGRQLGFLFGVDS